ncbi:MAG TPA: sigma-70 family RNA polymerase sigma factor [Actinomycetota bacterium]|nr:sigma-70 family RNA polymerase sigma factor [Actinomycetota bacterium]
MDQGGPRPVEVREPEDRELLAAIAAGDERAFRRLFRRYGGHANAVALRVARAPFLAEEAVQEAFVAVWEQAGTYDPSRGSVRAWLMGMVRNRAVDLVRREASQRRRADLVVVEGADDPADNVVADISAHGEGERLREALAGLPEEQRRVIELMYFGGLSQSKVADLLGLPLGTVKSRTLLGMRRLRDALAGMER